MSQQSVLIRLLTGAMNSVLSSHLIGRANLFWLVAALSTVFARTQNQPCSKASWGRPHLVAMMRGISAVHQTQFQRLKAIHFNVFIRRMTFDGVMKMKEVL
jgi:hypothetical protein